MKASLLLVPLFMCLAVTASSLRADSPPWTGDGVYTFDATDPYFIEGWIQDTSTVNITGGSFGALHGFDYSTIYMSGGNATSGIVLHGFSDLYLSGGTVPFLDASGNSYVELWSNDWQLNPSPYIGYDGILVGSWLDDGGQFEILIQEDSFSRFNIVPEPISLLLYSIGTIILSRKKR